jgi:NAD(P)-dependent dehydrogenase (short-subunit alcohol dehydrogenase family)
MKHAIIVCGHGPGISDAVARKFGKEGYAVAIVARNAERLSVAAARLEEAGVDAKPFPCDLSNPDAVRGLVREVRASLGPVGVIHWNAYMGQAGDLTTASTADFRAVLDVAVHGMIAGLQEALPDLKAQKGSLLVTGGGFAFYDPKVDAMAVQWNAMGVAVAKAAQHKLVGMLHQKLSGEGVYVGEVIVLGMVKGTPFDTGGDSLEPSAIADKFWEIHQKRSETSVRFPG